MGECILTSRVKEGEEIIIPISDRCQIKCTVYKADGSVASFVPINCKDGAAWYNYTTNEKGQVLFSCNSGSANIYLPNIMNGITYSDILSTTYNLAAPAGTVNKVNLYYQNPQYFDWSNWTNFYIFSNRTANIQIEGGGAGGGYDNIDNCAGGASGFLSNYNRVRLISGTYKFVPGGAGGIQSSGGTSYLACPNGNNSMWAAGGTWDKYGGTGYRKGGTQVQYSSGRIPEISGTWESIIYYPSGGASIFGSGGRGCIDTYDGDGGGGKVVSGRGAIASGGGSSHMFGQKGTYPGSGGMRVWIIQ